MFLWPLCQQIENKVWSDPIIARDRIQGQPAVALTLAAFTGSPSGSQPAICQMKTSAAAMKMKRKSLRPDSNQPTMANASMQTLLRNRIAAPHGQLGISHQTADPLPHRGEPHQVAMTS